MPTNDKFLTPAVLALFDALYDDRGNWGGTPLFGGNVADSVENKGHLTALKKAGMVTTFRDEGCTWVDFTPAGERLAQQRADEKEKPKLSIDEILKSWTKL